MHNKDYWVYILLCENQSFYTGYTDNIQKRYRAHLNGSARCKYTRSFKPLAIAQCWLISGDKLLAMQLEREIKRLSRKQKIQLINQPDSLSMNPLVSCQLNFVWPITEDS